jgi:hypothetical protein
MAARTVDPKTVKNLRDWVARWPKVGNLGFDPETREPTVYSRDSVRTKVASIPWRREGDVLTVLSQPAGFSEEARAAAGRRYATARERQSTMATAGVAQLRAAEQTLLEAWRAYRTAEGGARAPLMRDVVSAERAVREVEEALAEQTKKGRVAVREEGLVRVEVPVLPLDVRAMSVAALSGSGSGSNSNTN